MKIYLANDHTGVAMKQAIAQHLTSQGHEVINLGTDDTAAVNYASQGKTLGLAVANDSGAFGIGICGTGIGISIAANKVQGIIAGLVYELSVLMRFSKHHLKVDVMKNVSKHY
jgi:ribose 5-phosphate isomerase B